MFAATIIITHFNVSVWVSSFNLDCPGCTSLQRSLLHTIIHIYLWPTSHLQIIKGKRYTFSVDWWSYGVLCYEMITGQVSPASVLTVEWNLVYIDKKEDCNCIGSASVFLTFSLHSVVRMRMNFLTLSATPKSPTPDFWTHTLSTTLTRYSFTVMHVHIFVVISIATSIAWFLCTNQLTVRLY